MEIYFYEGTCYFCKKNHIIPDIHQTTIEETIYNCCINCSKKNLINIQEKDKEVKENQNQKSVFKIKCLNCNFQESIEIKECRTIGYQDYVHLKCNCNI